ncbi:MAG: hypothetical protein J6A15_00560 [Clostridia bacterium]|nr:hypothetical protein [Clostridia bacterium]
MATGFFRVVQTKQHGKYYYKYSVRNRLVKKELMSKDIKALKEKVESHGFLWGIINEEEAEKHTGDYKLKALQGRYGIQIGD